MVHKVFENANDAFSHANKAISTGSYKDFTIVESKDVSEGYKVLPPMDPKYVARKGLEGPFSTLSGKVVYYDPKEGSYYDPDTDMYMSYDEFQALDNDYRDMKDERDVNEISDKTLKSYHQKAIRHGVEVGMGKTVTDKDGNTRYEKPSAEQEKLSNKRITGAAKAMNKVFARKKSANNEAEEAVNEISPDLAKRYTKAAKMDREFNDDDITRLAKSGQSTQDMHRRNSKRTKGIGRAAKVINKQPTNEGISDDAHHMERDHEVQMARSDLYKTANYAIKLHAILKGISEEQGLEGWMQAKITKAADYMSSVFHALEYDELERSQSEPIMPAESVDEARRTSYQAVRSAQSKERALKAQQDTRNNLKKHDSDNEKRWKQTSMDPDAARKEFGAANVRVKKGALRNGDDMVEILETTTAGGIATAPMPMGKVIKRKKK